MATKNIAVQLRPSFFKNLNRLLWYQASSPNSFEANGAKNRVEVDRMNFTNGSKQIVVLPPGLDIPVSSLNETLDSKRAELGPLDLARDQRELCKLFRSSEYSQPTFYSSFNKTIFPDLNPCFTVFKELSVEECEPPKPKEPSKHGGVQNEKVSKNTGGTRTLAPGKEMAIAGNPSLVPPAAPNMLMRNDRKSFGAPQTNQGPPPPHIPALRRNQAPYFH